MTDDADVAFADADVALLVGAMPRKAGMERADLLSANGGIFKPQGEALSRSAKQRRPGARGRQPGQHERPHRPGERQGPRPEVLRRDDPPRPQPGGEPAGPAARRARDRRQEAGDLGQPLDDAVPEPLPRRGRRAQRLRGGRRPRVGRADVHPDRRQAWRGDHRGSRRIVGGVGGERRRRPHPLMGARHAPGRLDVDGGAQRRQLRRATGRVLQLPGDVRQPRLLDRPGSRDRRLQPGPHRCHGRRARRGARRRARSSGLI